MKIASLIHPCRALSAAAALIAMSVAHAEDAPRVDALRVAKLASDYLATHGKGAPYIISVALEKDALLNGKTSWIVRWSHPVLAGGNKEVGMRVKLDGAVSYLIDDKSGSKKRTQSP